MRVGNLFNLSADAGDLTAFFEGVETREQLVSRLERLKRQGTTELLECLESLRMSVKTLLHDTLEMSASLDDTDDDLLDDEDDLKDLNFEDDETEEDEEGEEIEEDKEVKITENNDLQEPTNPPEPPPSQE